MVRNLCLAATAAVLFLVAGCTTAPVVEPDSDWVVMKPLIYDYDVVFDCVNEMITDEGFQVALADRATGQIETGFIKGNEDRVKGVQVGRRIRATVSKDRPREFTVHLVATRVERDVSTTQQPGEWRYVGRDAELLERLHRRFDREVEKRYKPPAPDKG